MPVGMIILPIERFVFAIYFILSLLCMHAKTAMLVILGGGTGILGGNHG